MTRKIIALVTLIMLSLPGYAQKSETQRDPKMDGFIDDLMQKMTLQEKIGQLNLPVTGEITTGQAKSSDIAAKIKRGEVGGLFNLKGVKQIREVQKLAVEESRLGIPLIIGMDVIHGYETVFPIPLGLSCTWDMKDIERAARISAIEASADGICWTFSPMLDISRDPRWGRVSEGNGEDPFLAAEIGKAMVRGYQGKDLSRSDEIMACVKHFALYGASEAGRDYNTVDMSRVRMYNEYFPPYKAAVEAGAGSIMTSFNEIDGIPATANRWLMTDVLRDQWGFGGFVVTDYTAISEMIAHGIGDLQEVSARALRAGTDMDMVAEGFLTTLEKSLKEGRVTLEEIDTACRRILEAKYKLGLFKDPYKYCDLSRPAKQIYTPEHRRAAREIAARSFVLLKNDKQTLPLARKGRIALVGPLADSRTNMPGTWSVAAAFDKYSSLKEGLSRALQGKAELLYAQGSNLMYDSIYQKHATMFGREIPRGDDAKMLAEALEIAKQADVIIAAIGEASEMSGEASSKTDLRIPDAQRDLLKALKSTGKPVVVVLFTGRPLVLQDELPYADAMLNVWFAGSEAADAIPDVLFGDVNPGGKLTMTFPRNVGQIPIHYNHKNTGRPLGEGRWFEKFRSNYLDVPNTPLFPFGYGLSYTTFEYGEVSLSAKELSSGGFITASIRVTNTGDYDGDEVVQMYIRDLVGTATRPVSELKGFKRIHLKRGESKTVTFTIDEELLKYYTPDLKYVAEPGDFSVMIGGNSAEVNSAQFTLK